MVFLRFSYGFPMMILQDARCDGPHDGAHGTQLNDSTERLVFVDEFSDPT